MILDKRENALEIFLNNQSLKPDDVIEYLRSYDSDEPLVLRYLQEYTERKKNASASYHNILAKEYVQEIFKLKGRSKSYHHKCDDQETLDAIRRDFNIFLEKSKKYDVNLVLKQIGDTWMMEESIYLLVRNNNHKSALETYIDKGMDLEAEKFCQKQPKDLNLLTTLFEIYMERYKFWKNKCVEISTQQKSSSEFANAKNKLQGFELISMNLLK